MTVNAGWIALTLYSLLVVSLTVTFTRYSKTKVELLVANRSLHWGPASLSIAATWVWAPALFVATQLAFTSGWVGVFWFSFGNILTLIIFGWVAGRLRDKLPQGFTISAWIKDVYSVRVQKVYLFTLSLLSVMAFGVQLLAGGMLLNQTTGMAFFPLTVALAAVALTYTLFSGIWASVLTDFIQMMFIAAVGLTFVPWAVSNAGGIDALAFTGESRTYISLLSGDGANLFWTYGLALSIGLLAGPFGDQSFWQRAWSIKGSGREVRKAFTAGAAVFALVPAAMATLGFLAVGTDLSIQNPQLANVETIAAFLPEWTLILFVAFILSGLISTLDSHLAAISSLAGHDLKGGNVKTSRYSMLTLAGLGVGIANIPGITIMFMQIFYGTLRSVTLLPTLLSVYAKNPPREKPVFYGLIAGIIVGVPTFAAGQMLEIISVSVIGTLTAILLPAVGLWIGHKNNVRTSSLKALLNE